MIVLTLVLNVQIYSYYWRCLHVISNKNGFVMG